MSGLIATAAPNINPGLEDLRLNRPDFRPIAEIFPECVSAVAPATFQTEWWPGGLFFGDGAVDVGMLDLDSWGPYDPAGGASSRFGFIGVTRDVYGSALGACTVKLYRTSDDALLDSVVSDASGNFLLNTPYYPDAHYIVAHKTASPDVDGVTQNTLVGT